jgi:hypothetical protein
MELKQLRNLTFSADDSGERDSSFSKFYPMIMNILPHLEVVGEQLDCENGLVEFLVLGHVTKNIDFAGTFMKRELMFSNKLPLKGNYPILETLYLKGRIKKINRSIDFLISSANLVHLALLETPLRQLSLILEAIGARLSSFSVSCEENELVDLQQIFHLCPNLSYLKAIGPVVDVHTEFWPLLSSHNFRLLQHFEVASSGCFPPGFLNYAFGAPKMEDLKLILLDLRSSDCRGVQEVLKRNKTNQLKSVTLNKIGSSDFDFLEDFIKMFKCVICASPYLEFGGLSFYNVFANEEHEEKFFGRKDVYLFYHFRFKTFSNADRILP